MRHRDSCKFLVIGLAALLVAAVQNRMACAIDLIAPIAGGGVQSPSKNGPATNAALRLPRGVAIDAAGNVYCTDTIGVLKIDSSGFISILVSATGNPGTGDGGQAASATLNTPISVALDQAGNLFVADSSDSKIRKIDTTGIITTLAGTGQSGNTGDGGPAASAQIEAVGVAVDQAGNVYILGSNLVRKVDTSGNISTVAGGGTSLAENVAATTASLACKNLTVDSTGNIYVDDLLPALLDNGSTTDLPVRLRKIDATTGMINTIAGGGTSSAGDSDGISALAATIHQFQTRNGLTLDSAGNLYFAETTTALNRVRRLDIASNTISLFVKSVTGTATEFASDGSQATAASPALFFGVAIDSTGNFYIDASDGVAGDNSGVILKVTLASGSTGTLAVQKKSIKLNFKTAGADTLSLTGSLTYPPTFNPAGKVVHFFIGTIDVSFTLTAKGNFSDQKTSFKLSGKLKHGSFTNQTGAFALVLKKQALAAGLVGLGFTNANVPKPGAHILLPIDLVLDTSTYTTIVPVLYSATLGKSGIGK